MNDGFRRVPRTPKPHCGDCGGLLPEHAARCPRVSEREPHTLSEALLVAEKYVDDNPPGARRLTEWALRREGIPVLP